MTTEMLPIDARTWGELALVVGWIVKLGRDVLAWAGASIPGRFVPWVVQGVAFGVMFVALQLGMLTVDVPLTIGGMLATSAALGATATGGHQLMKGAKRGPTQTD